MEADSTTFDGECMKITSESSLRFPFTVLTRDLQFYQDNVYENSKGRDYPLIRWLQEFALIPTKMRCPSGLPNCNMICKPARVIDKLQWLCEECGVRIPVRSGSFFMKLQCSILQALQLILAWCEDADYDIAAQHFGVKPRIAFAVFEKLDDIAVEELTKEMLGGLDKVVLSEMFPDCVNRLSPDTTDEPHSHRILMLADTNNIPTQYRLHVLTSDTKRKHGSTIDKALSEEALAATAQWCDPRSWLVRGAYLPEEEQPSNFRGIDLATFKSCCDNEMKYFLSERIWRQAVTLCSASRDICMSSGAVSSTMCAKTVQRYLNVSLYRVQQGDGFYENMLRTIAQHCC